MILKHHIATKNFKNNEHRINMTADAYSNHYTGFRIKSGMTKESVSSLDEGRSPATRGVIGYYIRFITAVCAILIISTQAMATECTKANGTEIKGNNGVVYCKSNRAMNWWTALAWCQTIGKTAIRYPEDCRCVGTGCPETTANCPNLAGVGGNEHIWTSTPSGPSNAYDVNLSSGNFNANVTRRNDGYALCY